MLETIIDWGVTIIILELIIITCLHVRRLIKQPVVPTTTALTHTTEVHR